MGWIADLQPGALAPYIASMIEQGLAVMKKMLEATASGTQVVATAERCAEDAGLAGGEATWVSG